MAKRPPEPTADGDCAGRCAVYTRKSTDEGLDQTFNSLDAQREACGAYVASQRHQGWTLVPTLYDDGGFSGGSMERPALRRLLADVDSGRVDIILVYKVDRLTRSLADFAKIVDVLDARGASFVSVTQAFNTTTSMGRLTLNVLLSFAQFEREMTGERIRDKIAASKKKGMWMGGPVPLGYTVCDRKLIVDDPEAQVVRFIFQRHRELGTIQALVVDLAARGVVSKRRVMRNGRQSGGERYRAGALAHMLRNVLYTGKVSHKGRVYPGEHDPIIDQGIWDTSQAILDRGVPRPRIGHIALLGGMIHDVYGRPMTSAHANKRVRRYHYYVSRIREGMIEEAWRLPAGDLDAMVVRSMLALLRDPLRLAGELGDWACSRRFASACAALAQRLAQPAAMRVALQQLAASVVIFKDRIEMKIQAGGLGGMIGFDGAHGPGDQQISLNIETTLKRRGHELRLIYAAPGANPAIRDNRMIKLIARGHAAYDQLLAGHGKLGTTERSHLVRLARLRFLAPDIVTAIINGKQPVELTSRTLLRVPELPFAWTDQRTLLGFG